MSGPLGGGHWWAHLKKKIDTDHCSISNIFISLCSAEAENQKVSGMQICIRPNCPNWRPCMQIAIYDSSLWSICTTRDNSRAQSGVKIQQNYMTYLHLSGKLSVLSFIQYPRSNPGPGQREMSGDGHFWHWQLVSLAGQMLLRGKANWMILLLETAFDALNKCPITARRLAATVGRVPKCHRYGRCICVIV